jgi:tol-pal system protein YbgF
MSEKPFIGVLLAAVLIGAVAFVGCSTTGNTVKGEAQVEESADLDELLGLTEEKKPETAESENKEENIPEDDVLKLLGVSEEKQPEAGQGQTDVSKQVENLEAADQSQAAREQQLRDEVAQQNQSVANLESGASRGSTEKATPSWKSTTYDGKYQEALQEYKSRKYREAIQKFETLLDTDSRHSLSDNCQYWIGESYWGLSNYQQAIVAFEKVFSFDKSNKNDAAQLKIGLCYMRLNDNVRAKTEFQKLIDNYPASEYVGSAKRFLTELE